MDNPCQNARYIYSPLQKSRHETRVFRLKPTQDSHPRNLLSFRMSHVALDDHTDYYAISYACGDNTKKTPVLVDGCILHIYQSLEIVLRSSTAQFPDRTWWADALSINQDDKIEKGYQVEQLGNIYSQAQVVMVWLGPGNIDSLEALVGISILAFIGVKHRVNATGTDDKVTHAFPGLYELHSPEWLRTTLKVIRHLPDHTYSKIDEFFDLTWWERLWTLQEICLAERASFFCGEYCIENLILDREFDIGSRI